MKKLFSIMLGRYFALAFLLFFSGKSFAENDNYTRAADTFKAIEKLYGVEDVPLFRETYPFDNHLKVSYLSNQEQAEQQKLYSYLWPFSGSLSAVTALLEVKPKSDFRKVLTKTVRPGLEMYLDTRRTPTAYASYINTAPVSDRFYDDNIWIGLDFTDLYLLTGKKGYLSQAKMVWRFIESGTDDKLGYGIYWCEQKKNGKNTCSNAPGSVYASKLFLATGDSSYLQTGIRLYEWTKENLQDPADGLYFDNKSLNGEIGRAKFAYNSGQMMQSAALLYRITGEKKYLQEAQRLAAACYNRFFSHDSQSDRKYKVLNRGDVWFTAIMFRGFVELYGIDHNSLYIDAFRENLDFAWTEMREKNGLFNDDWSGKTKNDSKWLLTQFAMVEMYARLASIDKENSR